MSDFADNYFRGTEGTTHYQDVYVGNSATDTISAYVNDFGTGGTNYAFRKDGGGVPEPTSWALMISGFGLTGGPEPSPDGGCSLSTKADLDAPPVRGSAALSYPAAKVRLNPTGPVSLRFLGCPPGATAGLALEAGVQESWQSEPRGGGCAYGDLSCRLVRSGRWRGVSQA